MIRFKKRYIVIAVTVIFAILFVWRVYDVKSRFPAKQIEECRKGEWIDYNPRVENMLDADVKMSPVSMNKYNGYEFIEKYPVSSAIHMYEGFEEFMVIVIEFQVQNCGDSKLSLWKLVSAFEFVSSYNGYGNAALLIDENDDYMVEAGETKNVEAAVIVNQTYVGEKNMQKFLNSEFYLLLSGYPLEKRLVYE